MSNDLVPIIESDLAQKLAVHYGVKSDAFINTMCAVAMPPGHTLGELISCLIVAAEHKLNPLTKEIYFMKGKVASSPSCLLMDGLRNVTSTLNSMAWSLKRFAMTMAR